MPQLDKLTYFTQIFWLLITFTTFYFVILKNILPNILLNIKTRENLTNNMLSSNEAASGEINKANNNFVNINATITDKMQKVLTTMANKIKTSQQDTNQLHKLFANEKTSAQYRNIQTTRVIITKL